MFGKPSGRFYEFNARAGRRFQNLGKVAGGRSTWQEQLTRDWIRPAKAPVSGFQVSGFKFVLSSLSCQLFSRNISTAGINAQAKP